MIKIKWDKLKFKLSCENFGSNRWSIGLFGKGSRSDRFLNGNPVYAYPNNISDFLISG